MAEWRRGWSAWSLISDCGSKDCFQNADTLKGLFPVFCDVNLWNQINSLIEHFWASIQHHPLANLFALRSIFASPNLLVVYYFSLRFFEMDKYKGRRFEVPVHMHTTYEEVLRYTQRDKQWQPIAIIILFSRWILNYHAIFLDLSYYLRGSDSYLVLLMWENKGEQSLNNEIRLPRQLKFQI